MGAPFFARSSKTLDGHRSGGYSTPATKTCRRGPWYTREARRDAVSASTLSFQHVHAAATPRYRAGNLQHPIFLLVACFQHVHPRKHVNTCVYAALGSMALIPNTFTAQQPSVSLQQPAGGDVSAFHPVRSTAVDSAPPTDAGQDTEACTALRHRHS
jgi:hypothetical protein